MKPLPSIAFCTNASYLTTLFLYLPPQPTQRDMHQPILGTVASQISALPLVDLSLTIAGDDDTTINGGSAAKAAAKVS